MQLNVKWADDVSLECSCIQELLSFDCLYFIEWIFMKIMLNMYHHSVVVLEQFRQ